MKAERIKEIEQIMRKYGSANCWTGTSGMLASIIFELLAEIKKPTKCKNNLSTPLTR